MDQRRSSTRSRTLLEARIVFNNRFSMIECTVRDMSETGAQISFAHPIEIPSEFELEIPKKGQSFRARVMWTRGKNHGLQFIQTSGEGSESSAPILQSEPEPSRPEPSQALDGNAEPGVREILDDARRRIAESMKIPEKNVRLRLEIDF